MKWNAADYAANSAAQHGWARELIARLALRGDEQVLDVGCGDGKVTAEIARVLKSGGITGIDSSRQMIEFARKTFPQAKHPNLNFQVMDARCIGLEQRLDVVFSSSVLHWVDDHPAFLRGASSVLRPGGRLLVSCGGKGNAQDVFLALRPELRQKRWSKFFRKLEKPYFFHAPGDYQKWLPKFGFKINTLKLAPKDATYAGAEGFAAWLRTTWLPYVQRVPEKVAQASCLCVSGAKEQLTGKMPVPLPNLREEFIAAVTDRYVAKHPPDAAGLVHVRMVRLEIDAVKI
jgi:trans-aconitate methyltransferase